MKVMVLLIRPDAPVYKTHHTDEEGPRQHGGLSYQLSSSLHPFGRYECGVEIYVSIGNTKDFNVWLVIGFHHRREHIKVVAGE